MEPVKIVCVVEGGVLTDVLSAGVSVRAVVVDYDTEGCDENRLTKVPQGDGTHQLASVGFINTRCKGPFVLSMHNKARTKQD